MWVTVLQSHPSVSIPTLTMQRTSRPWWMEGPFELPCQRLEPFRVEGSTLPVPRPVGLPDAVERQTHPPVGVGFRFPAVGFAHHPGVHTNGAHVSVDVAQFVETRRRNPHRRVVFGEPSVDDLGERSVLAHDDEYRRAVLALALFPFLAQRIPEPTEHGERHMCVLENRLGLHRGAPTATFRGPPALALLRRIVLRDSPIRLGLRERRIENRLGNLARIHGSTPKARQIASSFSTTSG